MRSRLRCPHANRASLWSLCSREGSKNTVIAARLSPARPFPQNHTTRPTGTAPKQQPLGTDPRDPQDPQPSAAARARALLLSTLSSCALLLSSTSLPALSSEGVTIKFPASRNPEIRSAQEVLVQAWGYVREFYVDPTFNQQDWEQRLQDALAATFKARSRDEALAQVGPMLDSLGDPFTRVLLPGGANEAFQAMTQAKIVSTGLLVGRLGAPDGPLVVSFVVEGSPAAEAGLREGDEVVAVNGLPVWALRGEEASSLQDLLRQDVEVRLKLLRPAALSRANGARAAATAVATPAKPGLPTLPAFSLQDPDSLLDSDPGATSAGVVAPSGNGGYVGGVTGARSTAAELPTATGGGAAAVATAAASRDEGPRAPVVATFGSRQPSGSSLSYTAAPSTSYQLPGSFFDVILSPAPVEFVPVQYAILEKGTRVLAAPAARGGGGGGGGGPMSASTGLPASPGTPSAPPSPSRVGYIRVVAFTEGVGSEVEAAIRILQSEGCGSWLLDLRSNPGGIVGEGLRVAELLLRPGQVFARVQDRSREEREERLPESARALVEGQPLAVLVDHYSASTAELLAGALRDDARALLLGQRTYGKGRTQQVVQLNGGATLLVSTDTYVTPGRRPVDKVGLAPDVVCRPGSPPLLAPRPAARRTAAATAAATAASTAAGTAATTAAATAAATSPPPPGGAAEVNTDDDGESGSGAGLEGGPTAEILARGQLELLARDACVRAAVEKLARGSLAPPPPPLPPPQQARGA